jgi:amino acid transporter
VYFGPDKMQAEFLAFNNGDPWSGMANDVLPGIGGILVIFAILNSSLANATAGANASTRVIFAMGRVSLLPRWFAAIHETHRTPMNAVHFQGILGIALAVGLGLLFQSQGQPLGGPLTVYVWIGYALGLLFAAMYVAVNLAVIGYFYRERRSEFSPIKHVVIPVLGILLLIPAFLGVLGGLTIPLFDIKLDPLKTPYDIVPLLVLVWMILGVVAYLVMRSRTPDALDRIGDVMTEG